MKIAIYGAGGMGAEFLTIIEDLNAHQNRWDGIVFVDDAAKVAEFAGYTLYTFEQMKEEFSPAEIEFTISVGEPVIREKLADKIIAAGYSLATIICRGHGPLGHGVILEPGVVVMTPLVGLGSFCHIGRNVLLQGYSNIGHNTVIGDNTNISCFVQVSGGCKIGRNVFLGIQSVVKEGITIGDGSIIGMCSPVLRDVPANHTVFHAVPKMVEHEPGTRALGGNYK